ncbi:MAG: glutamate--cysteine ligase [Synechococcus lacustris]|jgi:carboxylate-amine ligase
MEIPFKCSARPTVGIEWEIALVDPITGDLESAADAVFAALDQVPAHRVHSELLRNTVELVTGVGETIGDCIRDLHESMTLVLNVADSLGIELFSAGLHPFASWRDQEVTEADRYATLIDRTQWWGRQMLIYGMHVHVGMPDRDRVLPVLNSLLRYFPHLQALSASSPYYDGQDTQYASNRALLFQQLPTAGLPFQFESWAQYENYVGDLTTTGVIDDLSEVRWDIRPSPRLGTIEVRICDAMASFEEVGAVAALIHCLIVDLDQRLAAGELLPTLKPWHVQENKWRSARYGIESIIIIDDQNNEELVTDNLRSTVERLLPVAQKLGCTAELAQIQDIIAGGIGYQRQRAVAAAANGDLHKVVESVISELKQSHARQIQIR